MSSIRFAFALLVTGALNATASAAAPGTPPPTSCDRNCLYGFADRYLDALAHNDASRVPWAAKARYTENNVELHAGDGMWASTTRLADYRLKFADVRAGQVGVFSVVEESNNRSGFALRLKIENGAIAEAEAIVVRIAAFSALDGGANPFAKAQFHDRPILQSLLASAEGRTRQHLI